jgi:HSP20 family molecular chaperone IbpA
MKDTRTLLIAGITTVLVITLAAFGLSHARLSAELQALRGDEPSANPALLEELENMADQQTRANAPTSLFDPAFDPFGASVFGSDPFARLQQMQSQMDQLFNNMNSSGGFSAAFSQPDIAVEESDTEFRVVITLAEGSDVELSTALEDSTLSISAEIRTSQQDNRGGLQTNSTSVSQFSRSSLTARDTLTARSRHSPPIHTNLFGRISPSREEAERQFAGRPAPTWGQMVSRWPQRLREPP